MVARGVDERVIHTIVERMVLAVLRGVQSRFGEQRGTAVVVIQDHIVLRPQQLHVTRMLSAIAFNHYHGHDD